MQEIHKHTQVCKLVVVVRPLINVLLGRNFLISYKIFKTNFLTYFPIFNNILKWFSISFKPFLRSFYFIR